MKAPDNRKYHEMHWSERRKAREKMVEDQGGRCHYCKAPLDSEPSKEAILKKLNMRLFPPNFLKYPVHLHHCHKTGILIGAVHAHCNGVLWQYHGE